MSDPESSPPPGGAPPQTLPPPRQAPLAAGEEEELHEDHTAAAAATELGSLAAMSSSASAACGLRALDQLNDNIDEADNLSLEDDGKQQQKNGQRLDLTIEEVAMVTSQSSNSQVWEHVSKRNSLEVRNNIPDLTVPKNYDSDSSSRPPSIKSQGAVPKMHKKSPGLARRLPDGTCEFLRDTSSSEKETDNSRRSEDREVDHVPRKSEERKDVDSSSLSRPQDGGASDNEGRKEVADDNIDTTVISAQKDFLDSQAALFKQENDQNNERMQRGSSRGSSTSPERSNREERAKSQDVENEYDYVKYARVQSGDAYVGMRLAYSSSNDSLNLKRSGGGGGGGGYRSSDDDGHGLGSSREGSPEKQLRQRMSRLNEDTLTEIPLNGSSDLLSALGEETHGGGGGGGGGGARNFSLSPEPTECDSAEVESVLSDEEGKSSTSGMPMVEDGLSSSQGSDTEDGPGASPHHHPGGRGGPAPAPAELLRQRHKHDIEAELQQLGSRLGEMGRGGDDSASQKSSDSDGTRLKKDAMDITVREMQAARRFGAQQAPRQRGGEQDKLEDAGSGGEPVWVMRESYVRKLQRQEEMRRVREEIERRQEEELNQDNNGKVYPAEETPEIDGIQKTGNYNRSNGKAFQSTKGYHGDPDDEYASEHDQHLVGSTGTKRHVAGKRYAALPVDDPTEPANYRVNHSPLTQKNGSVVKESNVQNHNSKNVQRHRHTLDLSKHDMNREAFVPDSYRQNSTSNRTQQEQQQHTGSFPEGHHVNGDQCYGQHSHRTVTDYEPKKSRQQQQPPQFRDFSSTLPHSRYRDNSSTASTGTDDGGSSGGYPPPPPPPHMAYLSREPRYPQNYNHQDTANSNYQPYPTRQAGVGGSPPHNPGLAERRASGQEEDSEDEEEEGREDGDGTSTAYIRRQAEGDFDTDEETDELLEKQYMRSEKVEIPELSQPPVNRQLQQQQQQSGGEKRRSRVREVLIEGVLFRARYLGSTTLISEGQPSKAMRMMQAQEAVGRIKAPEGENQPSTDVDLFVSAEKIMVLNTDLQEIMMDHALRTISYIADIGDILVIMARRGPVTAPSPDGSLQRKRQAKIVCHVFDTEEAQLIAQSIGQAFQVAYMEFLKANGIDDPGLMKEMDYQEVLNQQEIYGEELYLFANKDMQKEVVVPKLKGEPLGIVIVESGWGSMVPTVVLANMSPTGAANRCGCLNIGDQIMSINGVSLVGLPLSTCQTYIKAAKNQTVIKMNVVSCPPVVEVCIKRPDIKYQLGFSVQNGVICSLLRGGIAERGGVRVGHRIIEINSQSVVAVPHDKIVTMLASAVGEIHMKTMPTSIYRLITGQDTPHFI